MSRVTAYLQLVRAGALFSPACDVMAGMAVAGVIGISSTTGGDTQLVSDLSSTTGWSGASVRACAASVLVYAAGMALNDHADRQVDATVRPERPIPRGAVAPLHALIFGVLLMGTGIAISPAPHWHGLLAALVLAYDYLLRAPSLAQRWSGAPALGAVCMGCLRGLNLLTGACLLPGHEWPPLGAEHPRGMVLIYAAVAYAVAIVAITFLGILEDHRSVRSRAVQALLTIAPVAWFLGVLATAQPGITAWASAPAGIAVVAFAMRNRRIDTWNAGSIRGAMFWLLLGTALYDACLCWGQGAWLEGLAICATIPLARFIGRSIRPT